MPRQRFPRLFSFDPIARVLRDKPNIYDARDDRSGTRPLAASDRTMAEIIGTTRRTIQRWKRHGLTELDADRLALQLGYHPVELWGEQWWQTASRMETAA